MLSLIDSNQEESKDIKLASIPTATGGDCAFHSTIGELNLTHQW